MDENEIMVTKSVHTQMPITTKRRNTNNNNNSGNGGSENDDGEL